MLPFRAKRIRCLVQLVHNGPGVFGAKRLFLAALSCVKVFRSMFKAMSFQGLHWLQKLGSCEASFGAVAIGNPERHVRKASHRGSKQQ